MTRRLDPGLGRGGTARHRRISGCSMPRHVNLQPDAPAPVFAGRRVLALAGEHVPHVRSTVAVEESRGEARAYLIDDGLVLKVQRPQQLRLLASLTREVLFLQQLDALPGRLRPLPRALLLSGSRRH